MAEFSFINFKKQLTDIFVLSYYSPVFANWPSLNKNCFVVTIRIARVYAASHKSKNHSANRKNSYWTKCARWSAQQMQMANLNIFLNQVDYASYHKLKFTFVKPLWSKTELSEGIGTKVLRRNKNNDLLASGFREQKMNVSNNDTLLHTNARFAQFGSIPSNAKTTFLPNYFDDALG